MRKLLSKATVLAALAAAMMTATAAAAEIGTGVVEADSLRVRTCGLYTSPSPRD